VQCNAVPGAVVLAPTDVLFFLPAWSAAGFQCQQGDKVFSDFSLVGVPNDLTMRLTVQGTAPIVDTINFAGNLSTAFTISYTVTVDPTSLERIFQAAADLSNPGHAGNPSVTKTVIELSPGVFTGSTTASYLGGGGTPISVAPPATSLRVTDAYTPNGGAATQFGNSFFQAVPGPVPEPATTALCGAGLFVLGFITRRRRTNF